MRSVEKETQVQLLFVVLLLLIIIIITHSISVTRSEWNPTLPAMIPHTHTLSRRNSRTPVILR